MHISMFVYPSSIDTHVKHLNEVENSPKMPIRGRVVIRGNFGHAKVTPTVP